MNNKFCVSLFLCCMIFTIGCSSTKTYEDSDNVFIDSDMDIDEDQLSIADIMAVSDAMIKSIENSISKNELKNTENSPAILVISRIVNNTSQQFDTKVLIDSIGAALLKTGKFQLTSTLSESRLQDESQKPISRDYELSGNIKEFTTRNKGIQRSDYVFTLSLSDGRMEVWKDVKVISKKKKNTSPGF